MLRSLRFDSLKMSFLFALFFQLMMLSYSPFVETFFGVSASHGADLTESPIVDKVQKWCEILTFLNKHACHFLP